MLKIPSKFLRGKGVIYVAIGTIVAGQLFFIEGHWGIVRVNVSRSHRGCLRKRDVSFMKSRPLSMLGD
jgi:hypothetical protein